MTPDKPEPDSDAAWEQWWDIQNRLCHEVDDLLDKAASGRSAQFGAALAASLIEHMGEKLRVYLRLPESDVREESTDG